MRIAIAGFMHESNTFNPLMADRAAFQAQCLKLDGSFVEEWRHAHHEVGAFIECVEKEGQELLPIGMAWATPSGPVADDVFEEVTGHICDTLKRQSCDGLLLALHGAMVTKSHLDADGETLRRIRQAVGPDFPIVVTFDLHANLSQQMIDHCTAAVTYRTNPHVDQRETGERAAELLKRILKMEIRPRMGLSKPPVIISLVKQNTFVEPLRMHYEWLLRVEAWRHFLKTQPVVGYGMNLMRSQVKRNNRMLSASLALGFPYADVPQMGPSVLVIADEDTTYAQLVADQHGAELCDDRESFRANLPSPGEAVRQALQVRYGRPALLVDFGDNVGGGSAADGTVLLAELLKQDANAFVVCLFDPEAVHACVRAGVGGKITTAVGGKVDKLHGEPVEITGVVRQLHDGTYIESEVRHGGKRVNHMGQTALVELPGKNLIVLNSLRHPPFSLGQLTCLGIEPHRLRIIVVKAAIAYKAAYAPLGGTIIEVDTPGLTAVNPERFEYKHIRRPMFPLD
jgi:microcystin degradation protein MlrC